MGPLFFSSIALPSQHVCHKDSIWILESLATGKTGWSSYAKTLHISSGTPRWIDKENVVSDLSESARQELLASAFRSMTNIRSVVWDLNRGPRCERSTITIICDYLRSLALLEDLEVSLGSEKALPLGGLSGLRSFKVANPYREPCEMVQQVSQAVTQSPSLTTLHVDGSRDWSELWYMLRANPNLQTLRLRDVKANIVTADLLAYLGSYAGLENLSLHELYLFDAPGTSGDQLQSDQLAETFFRSVLPRHAESLVKLACPTSFEGLWSFGAHNVGAVSNLHKLTDLKMSVNSEDEPGGRSVNTVELLLRTAARLPSLRNILICPAMPQTSRGTRYGKRIPGHFDAVERAIKKAIENSISYEESSAILRVQSKCYTLDKSFYALESTGVEGAASKDEVLFRYRRRGSY
ncbi:hypothetical protein FB451DRAFT_1232811 [Mycena latifolia]|nr:hypothetical protein FB451DRAFT_1232811 [Mycena latifolia]